MSPSSTKLALLAAAASLLLSSAPPYAAVDAACLEDPALDAEFVALLDNGATSIPQEGSCCQADVCGLACPEPVSAPKIGTCLLLSGAMGVRMRA